MSWKVKVFARAHDREGPPTGVLGVVFVSKLFVITLYDWFKFRDIVLYNIPKFLGAYRIVAMNEDVTHSFYVAPWDFGVAFLELFWEFVWGFSYDFNVFDEPEEYDGVVFQADEVCVSYLTLKCVDDADDVFGACPCPVVALS